MEMTLAQGQAQLDFNRWNERLEKDIVILDTETTGLKSLSQVCEVGVINGKGETVFHSLVKPAGKIPPEAEKLHGITNDMVKDAPIWPEVWEKLYPQLQDKLVLIFNKAFDTRVMYESFYPYLDLPFDETEGMKQLGNLRTACVMKMYAQLYDCKWPKLSEISGCSEHRAIGDCQATLKVIQKCYDPSFTKEKFRRLEQWHELEKISKRIRYLSYRIKEMSDEQALLLQKQKQLQKQYFGIESMKEEVAVGGEKTC